MSFSLCIAFTYCTDDLVQGNEEGKFIDRDVSVRNILRISRQRLKMSVRKSLMCINHPVDYYSKHKKTISTQRKLLDVHQYDHVVRPSMLRKNPFCLKHFSEQGTTDHESQTTTRNEPLVHCMNMVTGFMLACSCYCRSWWWLQAYWGGCR